MRSAPEGLALWLIIPVNPCVSKTGISPTGVQLSCQIWERISSTATQLKICTRKWFDLSSVFPEIELNSENVSFLVELQRWALCPTAGSDGVALRCVTAHVSFLKVPPTAWQHRLCPEHTKNTLSILLESTAPLPLEWRAVDTPQKVARTSESSETRMCMKRRLRLEDKDEGT